MPAEAAADQPKRFAVPPESRPRPSILRKYLNIFRVSLTERMHYRGDFLIGSLLRFFPMITTILFWHAVYQGAGSQAEDEFAGYTLRQTVAYLLLVHVSRAFSSMPGLAGGIARDIRDGNLKKYLIQPLDLLGYLVAHRAAHKVAYIVTSLPTFAILFGVCITYFDGVPEPPVFAAYVASLLLAFVVGFYFEAAMGMIGFWFLEVTSILWVVNTVNYFISGQMFPLEFLPPFWAGLLKSLPFQYLAHFPATVFLGKVPADELVQGLCLQAFWAVVMILLARLLYARGLRRYSAFGG
jgi:ABC-2 type transport system permease protein